jgi:predicted MPP superfamily phosphohydrolase
MKRSHIKPLILTSGFVTLVLGVTCALYARFIHPFRPRVNHVMIQLPRAHKELDGLSIAFVTDTHIGPHFTVDDLEPSIEILRRASPDIVLFGGDYISESPRFLDYAQEPLTKMAATARIGAWGILGNHDLSNVRERVMGMLAPTGIRILTNEAVEFTTERSTFWLVGIDDVLLGKPDLEGAFSKVPADALRIALWHEGDDAAKVEPYEPLLLLSGHSHGGQVRLPFLGALAAPKMGQRYTSGRYEIGSMTLFVSNGIGMYRPPVRFNCPPEVVIFRLVV